MAQSNKGIAPLVSRMREDNIFMGGTQGNLRAGMDQTYGNLRAPIPGYAQPASGGDVFTAGIGGAPSGSPSAPLNVATGNIFGGGISPGERTAAIGSSVPEQVAGVLAGSEDQGKVAMFQNAVKQAGFNLDPTGQLPEEYQGALRGAQNIYNNIFGAGLPAAAPAAGGYQAFAPTDLRARAIAANGNGVWGTGDVGASATRNKQGGYDFSLGQATFPGQTVAAPQPAGAMTKAATPDAYTTNAANFKDHLVTQQMQAGLMKALPPGYMLDPNNRGRIMPIPGGPAEQKVADDTQKRTEDAQAKTEKVRQVAEVAGNVVGNIDQILPKIDNLTAGPVGGVAQHVPGTAGFNVGAILKGVKANLGVQQLQSMRDASKTGASGFGQLSEKELDVVTSTVANLDQAQDPEQLKAGLAKVRDHFNAWKLSYEAGQKAANGTLSPQEQAKTLLAIRAAAKNK